VEYYDETQNDMTAQTQRLQNESVDVIAFYGMPVQTGSIKVTRETLNWDVPIVITGVDAVEVVARLAGGGDSGFDNIEGAVSVVFGYQAFETDKPGVARYREIMAQYAPDAEISNLTITGYTISEAMVNNLKQAGPNLTRESFLDAAESVCEFLCSTCMVPTSVQPDDHRPTEVEVYVEATDHD
jgi:branched-chain amino acid transport system substrate-binding protein